MYNSYPNWGLYWHGTPREIEGGRNNPGRTLVHWCKIRIIGRNRVANYVKDEDISIWAASKRKWQIGLAINRAGKKERMRKLIVRVEK